MPPVKSPVLGTSTDGTAAGFPPNGLLNGLDFNRFMQNWIVLNGYGRTRRKNTAPLDVSTGIIIALVWAESETSTQFVPRPAFRLLV
jgi:hypothetical protein